MKKGKRTEKSFPGSGIGEILAQSLTMDQIAHLLDVVFAAEDTDRYSDEFKKADPDMAKTVERVLAMNSGEESRSLSGCNGGDKFEHFLVS